MKLTLDRETERFIEDEVKSGRFATAESVVEAAIAGWRQLADLDDETIAALNAAEAEGDRGEGVELAAFRKRFAQRRFQP